MKQYIEDRIYDAVDYTLQNRATVRDTAKKLGVSKTTVHKDLTKRLPKLDPKLYEEVREVLDYNIEMRNIRGGNATREKAKGVPRCIQIQ